MLSLYRLDSRKEQNISTILLVLKTMSKMLKCYIIDIFLQTMMTVRCISVYFYNTIFNVSTSDNEFFKLSRRSVVYPSLC